MAERTATPMVFYRGGTSKAAFVDPRQVPAEDERDFCAWLLAVYGSLDFVDMEMKAAGLLDTGVELVNPDLATMARGAGPFAARVTDPADLAGAMREAFARPGPALLDVVPARQELSMPPKIGVEQATGLELWVAKAVLNGRGDEVVDLARTNLLR